MGANNFRGVYVPDIDEDIHQGITALADGLGVVTRVSSIAAARSIVEEHQEQITPASPAYFDINGLIYVHDGTVFKPVNESEISSDTYTGSGTFSVSSGQYTGMVSTSLGVKPYDRSFIAIGMAWGAAIANSPFLCLKVEGTNQALGLFTSGEAQSVTILTAGVIPAGMQPNIAMGILGGSGSGGTTYTSTIALSSDTRLNRLVVVANPVTMA